MKANLMKHNVSKPIQSLSAVDGLSISQMEQDLTNRSKVYHGYNYTTFPMQEGFEYSAWMQIVRVFLTDRGYIIADITTYNSKKYDPMTADIRDLLNNPTIEFGVEAKWR